MSSDASELGADDVITAAVELFLESGLDSVSMRRVSKRLGVSPIPLYSRVGNKDALIDAIAERLLQGVAPDLGPDEAWPVYAARWAQALRARLILTSESRLIVARDRQSYVEASRPLIEAMRRDGVGPDASVQACRLIMWATVGFSAVQAGAQPVRRRTVRARPGGDPSGVDSDEADALFAMNVRYLIDGLQNELTSEEGA